MGCCIRVNRLRSGATVLGSIVWCKSGRRSHQCGANVGRQRCECAWLQVSWQGRDAGGHPVLVVRIGEAIASCDKERGAQFANAIITQVRCGNCDSVSLPALAQVRAPFLSGTIRTARKAAARMESWAEVWSPVICHAGQIASR